MRERILFVLAVIVLPLFGFSCIEPRHYSCGDHANTQFEGCFEGEITTPVSGGDIQLILNSAGMPGTKMLAGCVAIKPRGGGGRDEFVTLSGEVKCGGTEAQLQGLRVNGLTLRLKASRQPPGGNAVTVDVISEDGTPFASALALPRCRNPVPTCLDIGMRVPFGSEGQP